MKSFLFPIILISLLFSCNVQLSGQTPQFEWAWSTDTSADATSVSSNSVCTDLDGNVYTTGNFKGRVDFDPGADSTILDSDGYNHIFIQKLAPNGNLLWAASMGGSTTLTNGSTSSYGLAITTDTDGNVYVTGSFMGTADFDPGPGIANLTAPPGQNSIDIFVLKLDTDGNYIWAKHMNGIFIESGRAISTDPIGNVYITGLYRLTVDFDPGPDVASLTAVGSIDDVFVVKLDADGNYQWAISIGSEFYDAGLGIANDEYGNVYTTGYYSGKVDFDPGPDSLFLNSNRQDIFIQKLDTDGNLLWAKTFEGRPLGDDLGRSVIVDDENNVYLAGSFSQELDADPGPNSTTLTGSDFLIKLNSAGDFLWGTPINRAAVFPKRNSIAIDAENNIYTVGYIFGITDFDPGPDSLLFGEANTVKGFIQKFDTDGNVVWVDIIAPRAESISIDSACNIFVYGEEADTIDFDPGPDTYYLTQSGTYIAKFSGACDEVVNVEEPTIFLASQMSLYPVPSNKSLNIDYHSNSLRILNIEVISNTGQVVLSDQATVEEGINTISMDIESLPAGYYYVRTQQARKTPQIKPFIKISP